mgnify:CR=1 FL=1
MGGSGGDIALLVAEELGVPVVVGKLIGEGGELVAAGGGEDIDPELDPVELVGRFIFSVGAGAPLGEVFSTPSAGKFQFDFFCSSSHAGISAFVTPAGGNRGPGEGVEPLGGLGDPDEPEGADDILGDDPSLGIFTLNVGGVSLGGIIPGEPPVMFVID